MSVTIPALISYAIYWEMVLVTKRDSERFSAEPLATISTLGIIGIALTLAAFQPAVGIAFFLSTALTLEWAAKRSSR